MQDLCNICTTGIRLVLESSGKLDSVKAGGKRQLGRHERHTGDVRTLFGLMVAILALQRTSTSCRKCVPVQRPDTIYSRHSAAEDKTLSAI